ncbi:MAG: terminase small subunit [Chloroflexota bacterium]|nr:terminase small subunit [Chloroflexota bacterium]
MARKKTKQLSPKQQRCVELYFSDPDCLNNAAAAGRKAGFAASTAHSIVSLWFCKNKSKCPPKYHHVWDEVQKRREKLAKKAAIDSERLIKEETRLAFADIAEIFDDSGCTVKPRDIPEDIRRAIAGVDVVERTTPDGTTYTTYKYRFWDKGRALERLGKLAGLYIDKKELTHKLRKAEIDALLDEIPDDYRAGVIAAAAEMIKYGEDPES